MRLALLVADDDNAVAILLRLQVPTNSDGKSWCIQKTRSSKLALVHVLDVSVIVVDDDTRISELIALGRRRGLRHLGDSMCCLERRTFDLFVRES